MASIGTDKRGNRYVQFEDRHQQRRTLRLGKVSQRDAEGARIRVEKLIAAQILDTAPDTETARWVADVGEKIAGKMVKLGLIESRQSTTLGAFINSFKTGRGDVKDSTRAAWSAPFKSLVEHFGERKPLRSITEGDAAAWRRAIAQPTGQGDNKRKLAENTVRKRTAIAKT